MEQFNTEVEQFNTDTVCLRIEEEKDIPKINIHNTTNVFKDYTDTKQHKPVSQEEIFNLNYFWKHPLRFLLQCLTDIRRKIFPSPNDHCTIADEPSSSTPCTEIHRSIADKPFGIPDKIWWDYENKKNKSTYYELRDDDFEHNRDDYTNEYINDNKDDDKKKIEYINNLLNISDKLLKQCKEFSNIQDVNKWGDMNRYKTEISTKRKSLQKKLKSI